MSETYEGWSVRAYSAWQTLHPRPKVENFREYFAGWMSLNTSMWDYGMPEFPLDLRYKDFSERLDKALSDKSNT